MTRNDEAELGGAASDLEDRERERDADHHVSDRRSRLAEPEQAEGPLGERARTLAEGDHAGDVNAPGRFRLALLLLPRPVALSGELAVPFARNPL